MHTNDVVRCINCLNRVRAHDVLAMFFIAVEASVNQPKVVFNYGTQYQCVDSVLRSFW